MIFFFVMLFFVIVAAILFAKLLANKRFWISLGILWVIAQIAYGNSDEILVLLFAVVGIGGILLAASLWDSKRKAKLTVHVQEVNQK